MKWIGIVLVSGVMCITGMREAGKYKKAMSFWQEMERMALFFTNELRFTCDEPMRIFSRYLGENPLEIQLQNKDFQGALKEYLLKKRYEEAQICTNSVIAFSKGLGTTDLEGQLSHCGRNQRLFAEEYEKACEVYRVKGKLQQKLWLLGAVATALLLI